MRLINLNYNKNINNYLLINKNYVLNYYFLQIYAKNFDNCYNNNYLFLPFKSKKLINFFIKNKKNVFKENLFLFCGFSYAKTFLKVGLGFRKKYNDKYDIMLLNVVRRKIVYFKPPFNSFFIMTKRRSLYVFTNSKKKLFYYIVKLKYMRKETVYKYKGIFSTIRTRVYKRLTKTILFARRIKFKKIKLKLNKKQKLKK